MSIFSIKRRVNRFQFFIWLLAIWGVLSVPLYLLGMNLEEVCVILGEGLRAPFVFEITTQDILVAVFFGVSAPVMFRRFHDFDQRGGAFWIFLVIPGGYLFAVIYLLIRQGTDGENKYGKKPIVNLPWGQVSIDTVSLESSDDDAFYQQAYEELENGKMDKALWAKIFVQSSGDENRTKAIYITERVKQLAADQPEVALKPATICLDERKRIHIEKIEKAKRCLAFPKRWGWPGAMDASWKPSLCLQMEFPIMKQRRICC